MENSKEACAIKPDYARAESVAYIWLAKRCKGVLPVDVESAIATLKGTRLMTYTEATDRLGIAPEQFRNMAISDEAFTIKRDGADGTAFLMLTNGQGRLSRIRFSMAHELGHIALNHKVDDDTSEKEAQAFAAAFLCPRPILRATGCRRPDDVARAFAISLEAARIAVENARKPILADSDAVDALERHFGVSPGKRLEDYIDISYLANYYRSRLRATKRPPEAMLARTEKENLDRAIDEMENLTDSRFEDYALRGDFIS